VESSKFGNAIAALITIIIISHFYALALRRVAVKEVEILRQERKYRGPS
jgi:CPA2 family monovalent cation:H+ antiporter-2